VLLLARGKKRHRTGAEQGDASSDACRDQEHRVQGGRPAGLWTTVQLEDKKEADMDADKDDHAAVGALMQTCIYRGCAAPARASGASTQLSVHRYVSDLVLPSRNTSGSSLSRRNSASGATAATAAKAAGQDSTPTASVGGTGRGEFAPGSGGGDTSGCPIEALQYRSDPSKLYRPPGRRRRRRRRQTPLHGSFFTCGSPALERHCSWQLYGIWTG
jgi:hypothetical protein